MPYPAANAQLDTIRVSRGPITRCSHTPSVLLYTRFRFAFSPGVYFRAHLFDAVAIGQSECCLDWTRIPYRVPFLACAVVSVSRLPDAPTNPPRSMPYGDMVDFAFKAQLHLGEFQFPSSPLTYGFSYVVLTDESHAGFPKCRL